MRELLFIGGLALLCGLAVFVRLVFIFRIPIDDSQDVEREEGSAEAEYWASLGGTAKETPGRPPSLT